MLFLPAFFCATYLAARTLLRCWNPHRYRRLTFLDFLCAGLISCFALAYPLRWIPFIIGYLPQVTIPHKIRPLFYLLVGASLAHLWHEFHQRVLIRLGWAPEPQTCRSATRCFAQGNCLSRGAQTTVSGDIPCFQPPRSCAIPTGPPLQTFRAPRLSRRDLAPNRTVSRSSSSSLHEPTRNSGRADSQ